MTIVVLIDDATGSPRGIPLSAEVIDRLKAAELPLAAPSRGANAKAGNVHTPGTLSANVVQQDYFAAVTTRVVLPLFKERRPRAGARPAADRSRRRLQVVAKNGFAAD